MTFEIEVDGRVHAVTVQLVGEAGPAGGRFRISVRGLAAGEAAGPTSRLRSTRA